MSSMTQIELSDVEAKRFILFQQHHDLFEALLEAKVYEIKRGEAVLSFNHDGHLMHVEIKRIAYRKK